MSGARCDELPLVLVTGGKGGVGKTTLAANLGVHLARRGLSVLLVDLDLALANLHVLLGVSARRTLLDFFGGRALADCVAAGPAGVHLLPAASGEAELARLDERRAGELCDALSDLATTYDVAIADSAAGIGPDVLRFAARARSALIVTSPEPAALTDAYGLLKAIDGEGRRGARASGIPTPELVLNLVSGVEEAERVAGRLRGVAERFLARSPRMAGWLPRASAVLSSSLTQRPFALRGQESLEGRCLAALARRLERQLGLPAAGIPASSWISP